MPSAQTLAPAFINAFIAALKTRAQLPANRLASVFIASAPVSAADVEVETFALVDVENDQEFAALGQGRNEERFVLECIVQVLADGHGDDVATVARDGAYEILAEIESELRDNPNMGLNQAGTSVGIKTSNVIRKTLRQALQENYRRAVIEIDLEVVARI